MLSDRIVALSLNFSEIFLSRTSFSSFAKIIISMFHCHKSFSSSQDTRFTFNRVVLKINGAKAIMNIALTITKYNCGKFKIENKQGI